MTCRDLTNFLYFFAKFRKNSRAHHIDIFRIQKNLSEYGTTPGSSNVSVSPSPHLNILISTPNLPVKARLRGAVVYLNGLVTSPYGRFTLHAIVMHAHR